MGHAELYARAGQYVLHRFPEDRRRPDRADRHRPSAERAAEKLAEARRADAHLFASLLSWIILGGILIDILSPSQGIVNQVLGLFGIEPIYFLGDNKWFPFTIVATDVWKEFGFNTIVYLAALTSINPALYEAALIDGANRWKQTLYVTLPGMLPIIVLLATLSLGNVLNAGFDQIFNLYSPSVYETGDILDTLVYRTGLEQAQYSVATAIGLFKSVVSFVMVSVSYFLAYRLVNYRIF